MHAGRKRERARPRGAEGIPGGLPRANLAARRCGVRRRAADLERDDRSTPISHRSFFQAGSGEAQPTHMMSRAKRLITVTKARLLGELSSHALLDRRRATLLA